jgi:hypothetical protein
LPIRIDWEFLDGRPVKEHSLSILSIIFPVVMRKISLVGGNVVPVCCDE